MLNVKENIYFTNYEKKQILKEAKYTECIKE